MKRTMRFKNLILGAALAAAGSAQAAMYDLSTAGASATVNGAIFQQVPDQSTGTGVIEPFLRLQANGTEEGFNTDTPKVLDNKDGIWTHSLLVSDVPVVNFGGTNYYQVLLDINQNTGQDNEFLSLDQLKIYQEASGDFDSVSDFTTLRYDLDAGGDNWLLLNYSLNAGSGSGDMFAYIPTANFSGPNQYFYLYSEFGVNRGSNDGFEEWAITGVAAPIPEPETYALMLAGLAAVGFVARRRRQG